MECLIWMLNEINRNIKYVPQQESFYEKSCNEITKKCRNRDFLPEELEDLRSICVDEVHIGLQHPVEVNDTAPLLTVTAGSSRNGRNSRMDWV